ncbi:MAG: exosortase/archaeosortase family protein [Bacteroidales bacterium]|nr:exosortase/archaeosortase family protein [Bacteroidales bacterium]
MHFAVKKTIDEIKSLCSVESNRRLIKDTLLFFVSTVIFHFLYWNTDMNAWIFGPFTNGIFDFFTDLAFKGSKPLCALLTDKPFYCEQTSFYFYSVLPDGTREIDSIMHIIHDCSGVKQLLQWGLIMILCRGKWLGKLLWFLCGCVVIILCNILRITLLTTMFSYDPSWFTPTHDWVARPMMYIIIFAMWYYWLHLLNKKAEQNGEKEQCERTSAEQSLS